MNKILIRIDAIRITDEVIPYMRNEDAVKSQCLYYKYFPRIIREPQYGAIKKDYDRMRKLNQKIPG